MPYRFPTLLTEHPSEIHLHSLQPVSFYVEIDGEIGSPFPSMIHSYTEGDSIVIGVAVRDDVEIPVDAGTRVRLQTTQPDGIRTYFTHVVRRQRGAFPMLVLAWPHGVTRLNRRDSVRIATSIPVDVTFHPSAGNAPRILRTSTADLSESGMLLRLENPIPVGTPLSIRLHLPNTPEIHVCGGRVVRTGRGHLAGSEPHFWASVEFGALSASIQRSLRHFLWDVQREMLRRGMTRK
jgi:c-di-GMP-binding flagellar brake protein YcgR